MKNVLSRLFMLAIAVCACTQEEAPVPQPESAEGRVFEAAFEDTATRTYIEAGNLLRWNAGDRISLFDGNTLNRQYQFDGETGDNSGTFSIVDKPYGTGNALSANYAAYPYSSDVKITEAGVITMTFPSRQIYAENSFGQGANPMVAVTKDTDDTFLKFRNIAGYIKLQLYGDDVTVKSISLTGNDHEGLAGKASVSTADVDEPVATMSDNAEETILLDCGEGVRIGSSAQTATAFWIVVPPLTFEKGFTVTVTDTDGREYVKSTSGRIIISRNIIKPMAAFEVEIPEADAMPNNRICYAARTQIIPYRSGTEVFGAEIISNEWDDETGTGVITFDSDVTMIGDMAFYGYNTYCSSLRSIVIPDSVKSIGKRAFEECRELESVTMGQGITSIGDAAFDTCFNLTSITIPESVTRIGEGVFYCCWSLKEIKGKFASEDGCCLIVDDALYLFAADCGLSEYAIPSGVTSIEYGAFAVSKLTRITIPDTVTEIKQQAFSDCYSLQSITIPNSVNVIGDHAFMYCDRLSEVDLGNGVEIISESAFYECARLERITIPESVSEIGDYAFFHCSSLSVVNIQASTPFKLYADTFMDCSSDLVIYVPLESLDIFKNAEYWKDLKLKPGLCPDNQIWYISEDGNVINPENNAFPTGIVSNVYENGKGVITFESALTSVGKQAFEDCKSLTSITLPATVTKIDNRAFYRCLALTDIMLPEGVTLIGHEAFFYCVSMKNIDLPESLTTIHPYAFYMCQSLESIEIPDNVTVISDHLFYYCDSLKDVIIPAGVTDIGDYAFAYCSSMSKLKCRAGTPPAQGYGVFNKVPYYSCTLMIPKGSKSKYQADSYWKIFATIREE
ncbi:MAG: leucine-rich repeat protein [Bacteroidales bacterium]|nr:leucine-rich repeat protein [Bacteroidales bacterium]